MNQAFNRDCMDAMKEFPDRFFDLAVVDPPYGIGITGTPGGVINNTSPSAAFIGGGTARIGGAKPFGSKDENRGGLLRASQKLPRLQRPKAARCLIF